MHGHIYIYLVNIDTCIHVYTHIFINVCIHTPLYMITSRSFTKKTNIIIKCRNKFLALCFKEETRTHRAVHAGIILLPDSVGLSQPGPSIRECHGLAQKLMGFNLHTCSGSGSSDPAIPTQRDGVRYQLFSISISSKYVCSTLQREKKINIYKK